MPQPPQPTAAASASVAAAPKAFLLILVLTMVSLVGCGGDDAVSGERSQSSGDSSPDGDPEVDPRTPVALPPATRIPAGLNIVDLPEDVDEVLFSFTHLELIRDGGGVERIDVLVADTFERRTRGLMFRTSLPGNTGMLFAFPAHTTSPFWAKDTFMDLDIAFLADTGEVQEILRLEAESVELVKPSGEYFYALELPSGWMARRGVVVGSRFVVPPSVVGQAE